MIILYEDERKIKKGDVFFFWLTRPFPIRNDGLRRSRTRALEGKKDRRQMRAEDIGEKGGCSRLESSVMVMLKSVASETRPESNPSARYVHGSAKEL
jgi:hypothetical protein